MTKRILLSVVSFLVCFMCWAQVDSPYIDDSLFGTTITLKAKSNIYLPSQTQALKIADAARRRVYFTFFVNPEFFKPKKISKPTDLVVTGFIKTAKHINYDLYCVLYNGKLYFAYPSDVIDNTLIEEKNRQIEEHYSHLLEDLASKQSEFDKLIAKKESEIEVALQEVQRRKDNYEALVDSLYNEMATNKLGPMKEAYARWYDGLSPSAKKAANIVAITKSTLYSPNSAGGCDYNMEFTNNSNKTIKYLYWYGNVYNAVGDKVECVIKDTYSFVGRFTGPYGPGESGGSMWECIIYNRSAKEMRISSIKVNYTDGTSVSISQKDVAEIIGAPEYTIHGFEYDALRLNAEKNIKRSIEHDSYVWSRRKDHISDLDGYIPDREEVRPYFEDIDILKKEISSLQETIRKFEDVNFIVK